MIGGVLGLAAVAWIVGTRVQSPEQAAARADPPNPSRITAPVERRILASTIISRADVTPASSTAVQPPALASDGEASQVITAVLVARADSVTHGEQVVEVAGRPVFVFSGATPAYRTMRPGMSGADVRQLQDGLTASGCAAGESGTYDEQTKACVATFYSIAGYAPVLSSSTELQDLTAAEAAVAEAEDALATVHLALERAAAPPDPDQVDIARDEAEAARHALDAAVAKKLTVVADATTAADRAIEGASGARDIAQAALDAVRSDASTTPLDLAQAESLLAQAQVALDDATGGKARAIQDATDQADAEVSAARLALQSATIELNTLETPPDTQAEQLAADQQQARVDRAIQALADLTAVSGPVVPLGEIVFVAQLPARVDGVGAVVGETAGAASSTQQTGGALVVLASETLEAHVEVPQAARSLIQAGTPVSLMYEATSERLSGVVRVISDELSAGSTSGGPTFLAVVDAPFPAGWSGLNLRATFSAASTDHEVLVVPLAAVTSTASGQTQVQVARKDGSFETVPVSTGLSADGFVEVGPQPPEALVAGDQVVVGQ